MVVFYYFLFYCVFLVVVLQFKYLGRYKKQTCCSSMQYSVILHYMVFIYNKFNRRTIIFK